MATTTSFCCDVVLPEDVVFHILLWLPVMSLLRFKSVSKSWRSLIESSRFITQHLHVHHHYSSNLKDKNYSLIVQSPPYFLEKSPTFPYVSLLSGNTFEVSVKVDLPDCCNANLKIITTPPCSNGNRHAYGLCLVASCNGLVCFQNRYSRDVFLWNPATKEVRVLPQLSLVYQPREPENIYLAIDIALGFGLDETTNDFKVVRFFYSSTMPTNRSVEVYSLRSDSWSIVDPVLPFGFITSDPKAPYRNGTYCWLVRGQHSASPRPDNFILTFDFSNELFGTMQLPDVHSVKSDCLPLLTILRENLACINMLVHSSLEKDCFSREFEVWVLNEFGIRESWTKLYTVGPYHISLKGGVPFFCDPVLFSKNGEFLLLKWDMQLCAYELVTEEIKNLPVHGHLSHLDKLLAVMYKESLVSIKRGNGEASRITCAVELGSA